MVDFFFFGSDTFFNRRRVSLEPVSFWTRLMKSSGSVWMTLGEYVWMMIGGRYCTCGSGSGGLRIRCDSRATFTSTSCLRIPSGKFAICCCD